MKQLEKINYTDFDNIINNYLIPNKPVIIKDMLDTKSLCFWEPSELTKLVGNTQVDIHHAYSGAYNLSQELGKPAIQAVRMKFEDYVKDKLGDPSYYLQQTSVPEQFPELLNNIPVEDLLPKDFVTEINLWVGSQNSVSPLHYDIGNNFFIQFHGEKKFTLFSPEQTDYLYPFPVDGNANPHLSQLDIDNPDYKKFPLFKNAEPLEARLSAGDVLFIPATTWHQVVGESISTGVNIWFKPFDCQYLLPTITRFFCHQFDELAEFYEMAYKYKYSNVFEFCEELISNNLHLEASFCYMAILEGFLNDTMAEYLVEDQVEIQGSERSLILRLNDNPELTQKLMSNLFEDTKSVTRISELLRTAGKLLLNKHSHLNEQETLLFCNDIKQLLADVSVVQ